MISPSLTSGYGNNIFITGGSSGIGLACARLFAQNGYHVYAASRNPQKETLNFDGGGQIHPIAMDVCNAQSVKNVLTELLTEVDIGIVLHSAGLGIACPAECFPADSVNMLMDTNFSAILHLNSHFFPHFRKRECGLCVMISSVASIFAIPFQSHYCASKSALESYAEALRMEVSDYNIKVALVLPGDTHTGFTSARSFHIDEASPYYKACTESVAKMEKDELAGASPDCVAKVIFRLSFKKNPPLRTIVGAEYKIFALLKRILPYGLVEFILKKLYLGG
ncbi:MAG: SDR family NAD(P)-dependent oxidoreductase [Oscillospiraceae bacterium]|nr:SDR family NAD(P)-dependent oxidoreductase [Oscillospiraceae bacterium]